jgi:alkanesulfonate monooxygenase SsuD/methylene tetrahydromethanopterin reductase-like flavin-dependent oxidoreductase (luciferase family)
MKFDVFHSVGRVDSLSTKVTDRKSFENFFDQAVEAEAMGFGTQWVAESHFSSEVQKSNPGAVIPNYHGEVGLNSDSVQLAQILFSKTKTIGFGTAIMNILGGNGGPIASANRIRSLAFQNSISNNPRKLDIGVAAGRFPYINSPFGIRPRNKEEEILWPQYKNLIFVEALEIFLRLSNDEILSSDDIARRRINQGMFKDEESWAKVVSELGSVSDDGWEYSPRYEFDKLKLVPDFPSTDLYKNLNFVLGSGDPMAREVALRYGDPDVFNLSFTPPDILNKMHTSLADDYSKAGKAWARGRMPRTVLVFIDEDESKATAHAEHCFDTYIEAMRGTVKMPPREKLMERALIGTPEQINQQLHPESPNGFDKDDRLMLWFEFNQTDNDLIINQMKLFSDKVMPNYRS